MNLHLCKENGKKNTGGSPLAGGQLGACRARNLILAKPHQPPKQPQPRSSVGPWGRSGAVPGAAWSPLPHAQGEVSPWPWCRHSPMPRAELGWDECVKTGRSCPSAMAAAGRAGRWWHLGTALCCSSGSDLCHTWQRAPPPRPCLAQFCCVLKFESDAMFDLFYERWEAGMAFGLGSDGLVLCGSAQSRLGGGHEEEKAWMDIWSRASHRSFPIPL